MKRPTKSILSTLIVVAGVGLTQPAAADAYDAMLARAIAAKERALDTHDPADWEDALQLFIQADRIRSTKESKYELASAAARLRQDDLAVEAFETALALGLEGAARDKARAYVDEHSAQMGRLEVSGPAGAELWVGTRQRGTLPLGRPLVVFAGPNRVRVAHAGREARAELTIAAGASARIDLAKLLATPEAPSTAAPTPEPPPPRAQPPKPATPRETPETDDGRAHAWALLIGGAGTAVLGGAFAIGASSSIDTRRERLAELCAVQHDPDECTSAEPGQRDAAQSEVDAIATWKAVRIGGYIGLGVGAAAAGTGLVLLLGSSKREQPKTSWSVTPLPGGAAVSVTGRL